MTKVFLMMCRYRVCDAGWETYVITAQLVTRQVKHVFRELNRSVIVLLVNSNQFKKWLAERGATFRLGKGGHLKVLLSGKHTVLPMHGSKEIGKRLELKIKKDLGLK